MYFLPFVRPAYYPFFFLRHKNSLMSEQLIPPVTSSIPSFIFFFYKQGKRDILVLIGIELSYQLSEIILTVLLVVN